MKKQTGTEPRRRLSQKERDIYENDGVALLSGIFELGWVDFLRDAFEVALSNPGSLAEEYAAADAPGRFFADLNMWQEFYGKQYESTDEFLKGFLQHDIVEDVYGGWLESKEFDFSRFKRDKEYLFKIGVLFRDPWQTKMTIAELIAENVPYKIKGIIEDWYWNRVEELKLIGDI